MSKKTLVIIKSSPYKNTQAQEGLELIMAAAAFDMPINILFENQGILNLLKDQNSELVNRENFIDFIKAAELYEIEPIYIMKSDLKKFNLDISSFMIENNLIEILEENNLTEFFDNFKNILTY